MCKLLRLTAKVTFYIVADDSGTLSRVAPTCGPGLVPNAVAGTTHLGKSLLEMLSAVSGGLRPLPEIMFA